MCVAGAFSIGSYQHPSNVCPPACLLPLESGSSQETLSCVSTMGLFWDLIQHSQIQKQYERSDSLEQRVTELETELRATQTLLRSLLERLESHFGEDIDRDGRIG